MSHTSPTVIESGRVVAIDADALWVETIRRSTCESCNAQKACGHGLLNKATQGKASRVRVLAAADTLGGYRINDQVDIGIPATVLVSGALIVYLLPLFTMLMAALLVSYWLPGDLYLSLIHI